MRPRRRRGTYAVLLALLLAVLLGFGALALDGSWLRLVQAESRDVADAASLAATITLRRTGDPGEADAAARAVVDANRVGGAAPTLLSLELGAWDGAAFSAGSANPHAARARVGRAGDDAVPLFLARALGRDRADVSAGSTSATRPISLVVTVDIGPDQPRTTVRALRDGALALLDVLRRAHGEADRVAMVLSHGRRAWAYTPLATLAGESTGGAISARWRLLDGASRAGVAQAWPRACIVYERRRLDDFTDPSGGCAPEMPRAYSDEVASDPATALSLGYTLLEEAARPDEVRALLLLTARDPTAVSAGEGAARRADGYRESRFREEVGPAGRTATAVRVDANTEAALAWEDLGVHTWVVGFGTSDPALATLPRGLGNHTRVDFSAGVVAAAEDVARALPVGVVE